MTRVIIELISTCPNILRARMGLFNCICAALDPVEVAMLPYFSKAFDRQIVREIGRCLDKPQQVDR